jgi:hypothetical protein
VNPRLATIISQPSTPMLLGGQDQFLKVSIYTIDIEGFSWVSTVFHFSHCMSKFSKRFTETTRKTLEWEYFCSKMKLPTLEAAVEDLTVDPDDDTMRVTTTTRLDFE